MLLQLVFSAIPIFHLSIFKMLVGIGNGLEGLKRHYLWKGFGLDNTKGGNVSWDVVCKHTKLGIGGPACPNYDLTMKI